MTNEPPDGLTRADEPDDAPATDQLHRATIEFGLDDDQAQRFESLVATVAASDGPAGSPAPATPDRDAVVDALDDAAVAEAAWTRWSDDDLLGAPVESMLAALGESRDSPGIAWLTARNHAWHGRTGDATATLDAAARSTDHPLILCELAAVEADHSNPVGARELLRQAGVDVDIDLDTEFGPVTAEAGFGAELAEEIAPFAAIRPKAMAGRNDRCPCGSGKKYKQCHLGNELHALDHRASWLYVKLMRFIGVNNPNLPAAIAEDIVDGVLSDELRSMVHESYLPVDLALFEGGVAQWFLDAKRSLLPTDEAEMTQTWIDARRSVYEVERSLIGTMDVVDLATRERMTVVDTVPDEPLDTGWKLIGRLVPVADSFRAYGGFLPINDDMVDGMLEGFATRQLETVAITIGQIFETAASQDEIQDLFADSLDTGELQALIDELGDEADNEA